MKTIPSFANWIQRIETKNTTSLARLTGVALFCLAGVLNGPAQTYTVLHTFGTNVMGLHPQSALTAGVDGFLYGTTPEGGSANLGQVFKVQPDGSEYTVIKDFTGSDGAWPRASVISDGEWLYGTTQGGGTNDLGTIFKVQTNGAGFTVLRRLAGTDGYFPEAKLLRDGGTLYGVTSGGGPANEGTVFKLDTDGSNFAVLKTFAMDFGAYPQGALVISGNTLYGTTSAGGTEGAGSLFALNTDGGGFTVLKNFEEPDGAWPSGDLLLADGMLYGTTAGGGSTASGTVFSLNPDGSNYVVLHDFGDGSQGATPRAGLLLVNATLYGTTIQGGSQHLGVVFKVETNGSGFAVLKDFQDYTTEGASPQAGLVLSGANLIGAVVEGGDYGRGALFRLDTNGSNFVRIVNFAAGDGASPAGDVMVSGDTVYGVTGGGGRYDAGTIFKFSGSGSNYTLLKEFNWNDGSGPKGRLALAGATLYGTTEGGGSNGVGTVFRVDTNGEHFATLHTFARADWDQQYSTNVDGYFPQAGVELGGATLYGMAAQGGANGNGTVFKLETDGSGFAVLHTFSEASWNGVTWTNPDGAHPQAGMVVSGSTLYGTAAGGGSKGWGTVFKLETDGSGFTLLREFDNDTNGASPYGLVLTGSTLFGTTSQGGASWQGTVFTLQTDGSGFSVLKYFNSREGAYPYSRLQLSGTTLYGTASQGGIGDHGTVYQLNTDGSGFAVLKYFSGSDGASPSAGLALSETTIYGTGAGGGNLEGGVLFRMLPGAPLIASTPEGYQLDAGGTTELTVTVSGIPPLSYLWFFNGTNAIADGTNSSLTLTNLFFAMSGNYSVVVTNDFGSVTGLVATLSVADPAILTPPVSRTLNLGEAGLLTTVAAGTAPLHYQWRRAGLPLADATNPALAVDSARAADAGNRYDVVVSNACGSVTSAVAVLTVNLAVTDAFNPGIHFVSGDDRGYCLVPQGDGKILVGGQFVLVQGPHARTNLARLNADGTLDTTFNPGMDGRLAPGYNWPAWVRALVVQPNGKILVGGCFAAVAGQARQCLARLNSNGSLDAGFDPQVGAGAYGPGQVHTLAVQADGKILVGGLFFSLGGGPRNYIGRLNPDGTLDASFNLSANDTVRCILLQPDGKILVGGPLVTLGGASFAHVGRLNSDGTPDATFNNPFANYGGPVMALALQSDGKIVVGGAGVDLGGGIRNLCRLNANGSYDTTFDPAGADNPVACLAIQPDGKILAGGSFSALGGQPRYCFGRLNSNGSADVTFDPGINWAVECLAVPAEGRILVGGTFTTLGGLPRRSLGRLVEYSVPVLTATPQTQTAEVGASIRLAARASSLPPPQYLWIFNSTNLISTSTNGDLKLTNLQPDQSGDYTAVITNAAGAVTSAPVLIQVIPPVPRRMVPGLNLHGAIGSSVNLECTAALGLPTGWTPLGNMTLVSSPQWYFDLTQPLPSERFYRTWQTENPSAASLDLKFIPALTLTGNSGDQIRVDGIHPIGPTDAWFTLGTVILTNNIQLYFDVTAPGPTPRLYRLVPGP